MKKVLSLMLSLALIISTLALPIAVSAASDVSTANVSVSYTTNLPEGTNEVHPGDTFNLTVSLASDKEVSLSAYELYIAYDKSDYTITNPSGDDTSYSIVDTAWVKAIQIYKVDTTLALSATPTTVATIPVTVASTAAVNEESGFSLESGLNSFAEAGNTSATKAGTPTDTALNYTIKANTASIQIDGKDYEANKLYINKDGVKFKVTGTNINTVTYKQTDATAPTDVKVNVTDKTLAEITTPLTAGSYEVSVTLTGVSDPVKFTFRVSQEVVSGEIAIDFIPAADGYKAKATFDVPVKISGIGENKRGMASFDLAYDSTRLELTSTTNEGSNLTITPGEAGKASVSFGTADTGASFPASGEGDFVTLGFKVKEDATIGKADITIGKAQLTVKNATDDIVFENESSTITKSTVSPVVVPESFASVSSTVSTWTMTAYDVTIKPIDAPADQAISFKYILLDNEASYGDQKAMKEAYESDAAFDVSGNKININTDRKHYVIISEFNGVYSVVKSLAPGVDIWYDGTAPVINNTELAKSNMSAFAKSKTVTLDESAATDQGGSGIKGYKYLVVTGDAPTTETEGWTDVATSSIEFTSSTVGKLYILAEDYAGNKIVSNAEVNIKVDADDPSVSATAGDDASDGTPVSIEASDLTSNVEVEVYYSATAVENGVFEENGGLKTGVASKEKYQATGKTNNQTYKAQDSGFYYIYATDEAGNSANTSVNIKRASISSSSIVAVKVVKTASASQGAAFSSGEESNGTFGYVKFGVARAPQGFANTITATKNGEAYTLENAANLENAEYSHEFTEAGVYVVTVKTAHKTNTEVFKEDSYKFTIAKDQTKMVSPSGDNVYNVVDYVMIKKVANNSELDGMPTAEYGFEGRYSGDLNGDFKTDTSDVDIMLQSIKDARIPGYYNFAIMNGTTAPAAE